MKVYTAVIKRTANGEEGTASVVAPNEAEARRHISEAVGEGVEIVSIEAYEIEPPTLKWNA